MTGPVEEPTFDDALGEERAEDEDGEPFEPTSETMSETWAATALDVIHEIALTHHRFSVIDVVDRLNVHAPDMRAMGVVLLRGRRLGWYTADGWQAGDTRTRHGRPVRVWSSRICPGARP